MRHRNALPLYGVGVGQEVTNSGGAGLHGGLCPAGVLERKRMNTAAGRQVLLLQQAADLVVLAAESHQQDGGKVHMAGITCDGAAQHVDGLAAVTRAAAALVGQCDNTVHIREIRQRPGSTELVGDQPRNRAGTVHRSHHANVIARGNAAILTHDAEEGVFVYHRQIERRPLAAAESAVGWTGRIGKVVKVDVLAGQDRRRSEPDHLAKFAHRFTRRQHNQCQFMALGHMLPRTQAGQGNFVERLAGRNIAQRHDYRVGRVQPDGSLGPKCILSQINSHRVILFLFA